MLDLNMLKQMPPQTHFAQGETIDAPEGVNMANSRKNLKWVAVRGEICDWSIYILWSTYSYTAISKMGDKVCNEENIKKLVPCDEEAFEMYRY